MMQCQECNREFATAQQLGAHRFIVHGESKQYAPIHVRLSRIEMELKLLNAKRATPMRAVFNRIEAQLAVILGLLEHEKVRLDVVRDELIRHCMEENGDVSEEEHQANLSLGLLRIKQEVAERLGRGDSEDGKEVQGGVLKSV